MICGLRHEYDGYNGKVMCEFPFCLWYFYKNCLGQIWAVLGTYSCDFIHILQIKIKKKKGNKAGVLSYGSAHRSFRLKNIQKKSKC